MAKFVKNPPIIRVRHVPRAGRRASFGGAIGPAQPECQFATQRTRQRGQHLDDFRSMLHQPRTIADQTVATVRERIMDGTGQGEHLATLLGGQPRRDQRTRTQAGLDHQGAQRQAGNDEVV